MRVVFVVAMGRAPWAAAHGQAVVIEFEVSDTIVRRLSDTRNDMGGRWRSWPAVGGART